MDIGLVLAVQFASDSFWFVLVHSMAVMTWRWYIKRRTRGRPEGERVSAATWLGFHFQEGVKVKVNVKVFIGSMNHSPARWLNRKGLSPNHPRSYSVVAHHEGLSFLRPGFKSRYEHSELTYDCTRSEELSFPVRTWANGSSLRVEFFLNQNHG